MIKPIKFRGTNRTFGEGQEDVYQPLPAFQASDGTVISCWKMPFWERVKFLFTGKIWHYQLAFFNPLQPILLDTKRPNIVWTPEHQNCRCASVD